MEFRAGIGSGWIDIYRITHCQGTLLGLGSRSKGFRETSSSDRQRSVCSPYSFFTFLNLYPEKTELQAKLSLRLDHHHLQHQCVEFFHNLILIVSKSFYL